MGAKINGFDKYYSLDSEIQAFTVDKLSNAVTRIIDRLARDEEIFKLLYFEDDRALGNNMNDNKIAMSVFKNGDIAKSKSVNQRITPYPFNPSVQETHQAFIRVYFNQGTIDKAGYTSKNQVNIDIIVSHSLWLTSDPENKLRLIRPYAIMSRVIDVLESEKIDKLPVPTGFNHLTVNEHFECIRIYANLISTEKEGE